MVEISTAEQLLEKATEYRQSGFEGKARVTLRLAVASALKCLYDHSLVKIPQGSDLDLIKSSADTKLIPEGMQEVLHHFSIKVNEDYTLPPQIDLFADTKEFITWVKVRINGAKENMADNSEKIKLYATSWCGGSRRARNLFDENHIEYEWIDIDENVEAGKFVESVNRGYRSVPTIVFPDGTILTEPSTADLMKKLGVKLPF